MKYKVGQYLYFNMGGIEVWEIMELDRDLVCCELRYWSRNPRHQDRARFGKYFIDKEGRIMSDKEIKKMKLEAL